MCVPFLFLVIPPLIPAVPAACMPHVCRMYAILTQFLAPFHSLVAQNQPHCTSTNKFLHVMSFIRAKDVSDILDELEDEREKNKELKKIIAKLKASSKASTPFKSNKSPKSSEPKTSNKRTMVGFVKLNPELKGCRVWEDKEGRYVQKGGKKLIVSPLMQLSKNKPKP